MKLIVMNVLSWGTKIFFMENNKSLLLVCPNIVGWSSIKFEIL